MPLEETAALDFVSRTPEGEILLAITDSGATPDPERRLELLREKATNYLIFALSADFQARFSGVPLDRVAILVLCSEEPTPAMCAFTRIARRSDPSQGLNLRYQLFRPTGS